MDEIEFITIQIYSFIPSVNPTVRQEPAVGVYPVFIPNIP